MATINKPYTFSAGGTIVAAEHNSNFDTIYNEFNGSISNANISGSAAISDSKLAQITTAGKVSGAAITLLTSVPSGAGIIPVANLGSGTPSSSTFLDGAGAWTATSSLITAANALAGSVIQTQYQNFTTRVAGGTTTIPLDNSIPQSSEGHEFFTFNFTPIRSTSKLIIEVGFFGQLSANETIVVALFKDSDTGAIKAVASGACTQDLVHLAHHMDSPGTSQVTFKVRAGATGGGAGLDMNGYTTQLFGGVAGSWIRVQEIKE